MSKARRTLMTKLLDKKQGGELVLAEMGVQQDGPAVLTLRLEPNEVRKVVNQWGIPSWFGRSKDGTLVVAIMAVMKGRTFTDAEIIAQVRKRLDERVAEAAAKPKYPRASPKPTGRVNATLRARETVRAQQQQPAVASTRMAKCGACGAHQEVLANDGAPAVCARCGRGGI